MNIHKKLVFAPSTHRISFWVVLILLALSACSKDPQAIDLQKYEGQWKPIDFSDWTGMHNAPPFISRPGKTFYLNGDKISVTEVTMHNDTNGNLYTTSTSGTFNLKYDIQSKMKGEGSTILVVTEHYYAYTDQGIMAFQLNYKREVDFKNKSGYQNPNDKFDISENTINVWYYVYGGSNATIQQRKLVKIQ